VGKEELAFTGTLATPNYDFFRKLPESNML
jgi:hypothetical protein